VVYGDQILTCVACGGEFAWTVAEQREAAAHGRPAPDLGLVCRAYCADPKQRLDPQPGRLGAPLPVASAQPPAL